MILRKQLTNWLKQRLAIVLCIALVLGSFQAVVAPQEVKAADDTFYVSSNGDDDVNDGTSTDAPFATIEKALQAVNGTGTVVLLSDITLNQRLDINNTISVSGKTVTIRSVDGSTFSINRGENLISQHLIQIGNGNNTTFQNLIIDGKNIEVNPSIFGVNVQSGTTVVFENVEIKNHIVQSGSSTSLVVTAGGSSARVIIKEGTLVKDNKVRGWLENNPPAVLSAGSGGVLEIQGGLITGNEVSADSNGSIVGIGLSGSPRLQMTGGKITGNKLLGKELNASGQTVGNVAVYMRGNSSQARFDFAGTAYVYDNLNAAGEQRNVFLKNTQARNSAYLTLIQAMEDGAKVGVYANLMPDAVNPIVDIAIGYNGYEATVTDAVYFVSDKHTTAAVAYEDDTKKVILTPVAPGGVATNLALWLKADDGAEQTDGSLTGWTDKAPEPSAFTLGGPVEKTPQYIENGVNFNPAVSFTNPNKSNHYDESGRLDGDKEITIASGYAVFLWTRNGPTNTDGRLGTMIGSTTTNGSYGQSFFSGYQNGVSNPAVPSLTINNGAGGTDKQIAVDLDKTRYHIANFNIVPGDNSGFVDGKSYNINRRNTDFGPLTLTPVIGATFGDNTNNTFGFHGDVAEIILFDQATSEEERAQIESYLALKYGITLNEGASDYIAGDGSTTFWTAAANAGYGNRITGIGRDDASGLHQKQSKSLAEGANVTIALGSSVASSNAANASTIALDRSFFTFGDDNGSVEYTETIAHPTDGGLKRMKRIFKVEKTNWQDTAITLQVEKAADYLVVSSNEQFDSGLSFHALEDGKVTLNSSEFTDGSYFTFAAPAPELKKAALELTAADEDSIILTFDKEVDLTDLTGFTITIDGTEVTIDNVTFEVDLTDPKKLILTLPDGTDAANKEIKVSYDGTGNLQGANGVPVDEFEVIVKDEFASALQIIEPSSETVNEIKPTIAGKVEVGSTVTVTIKDADGNEITDAGGTATVDADGNWIFTPSVDLPPGTYTVEVTATKDGKTATKTKSVTIVDKTALQAKVTEINDAIGNESLQKEHYTGESWIALEEALQTAQAVLNDANATQAEVDEALTALTAARNGLVPVESETPSSGLKSIVPSTGTLQPNFAADSYDYSMTVGNSTSQIRFTLTSGDPDAVITINGTTVTSGQASDLFNLSVGENKFTVVVTEQDGTTKSYTITVTRQASSGGGVFFPSNPVQKITVNVEASGQGVVSQTEIERTSNSDGTKSDKVTFVPEKAVEAVKKTLEKGAKAVRIVIPDTKDEVRDVRIDLPQAALQAVQEAGLDLEIFTDNGMITIPNASLADINPNLYFYLVPIKKESERMEVEERAKKEKLVQEVLKDGTVYVVDRPMTIETNMTSRQVKITLPMDNSHLPNNAAERAAFLANLVIFIEHSDGERKLVKPEIGQYSSGKLGLTFTIEKFSTFTILNMSNWGAYLQAQEELAEMPEGAEGLHRAYINGYPDETFKPSRSLTRAEMAAILSRVAEQETADARTAYPDVAATHWAQQAISQVSQIGLMEGYPDGNFRPERAISRAEMAAIVARWMKPAETAEHSFVDVEGHWAEQLIASVSQAGYMEGYPNGSFEPDKAVTRAEAVTIINRVLERGPLYYITEPTWSDVPMSHWAFHHIEEASQDHYYKHHPEGGETIVE